MEGVIHSEWVLNTNAATIAPFLPREKPTRSAAFLVREGNRHTRSTRAKCPAIERALEQSTPPSGLNSKVVSSLDGFPCDCTLTSTAYSTEQFSIACSFSMPCPVDRMAKTPEECYAMNTKYHFDGTETLMGQVCFDTLNLQNHEHLDEDTAIQERQAISPPCLHMEYKWDPVTGSMSIGNDGKFPVVLWEDPFLDSSNLDKTSPPRLDFRRAISNSLLFLFKIVKETI